MDRQRDSANPVFSAAESKGSTVPFDNTRARCDMASNSIDERVLASDPVVALPHHEANPTETTAFDRSSLSLTSGWMVLQTSLGLISFLVVALVFVWEAQHSYGISAYDDIYDKLKLYRTSGNTLASLRQVFSLHNEHRIATTRILMVLDEWWDGGREALPIIAANMFQSLAGLLCAIAILRGFMGRRSALAEIICVGGLVLLLFVNPNLLETLNLPFQVQHAIMGLLAVLAAWQVGIAVDGPSGYRAAVVMLIRLVALAVVASLTLGNAPVLLLATFAAAVLFRWGWRLAVAIGVLAAVHLFITVKTTPGVGATTKDLGAILDFTILYLGSPFIRIMPWPAGAITWAAPVLLAKVAGVAVVAIPSAFALMQLLVPRRSRALAGFGFTLCAVVIVTAFAAGYARAQFGIEAASDKKYASFAALSWVGCLALAIAVARDLPRSARPATASVIMAAYLAVLPASVAALDREEGIWGDFMNRNWLAATAVYAGVGDRNVLQAIYAEPPLLREYSVDIQTRGRGVFSHYPFQMGDPASAITAGATEVPCRSEVEGVDTVSDADLAYQLRGPGTPVKVHGWTWLTTLREPADAVVAIDSADRIAGLAHAVSVSPRAALWLNQLFTQQLGWAGYALSEEVHDLHYLALSRDGKVYCSLGKQGDVR